MKIIIISILVMLLVFRCHGQIINIDKIDTSKYSNIAIFNVKMSLGLLIDKQFSDLYVSSNSVDISLRKNKLLWIFSGNETYSEFQNSSILNSGYVHLRLRNHYRDRTHFESFTQLQWNTKVGLTDRFLIGENIRTNLWYTKSWEMTVGTGIMLEKFDWKYNDQYYNNTIHIKSNNYIKWEGNSSYNSLLSFALFYQMPFNDFAKPSIFTNLLFTVYATKRLGLSFNYMTSYYSNIPAQIGAFRYTFNNSLIYKL